jgi:hypothetical protein
VSHVFFQGTGDSIYPVWVKAGLVFAVFRQEHGVFAKDFGIRSRAMGCLGQRFAAAQNKN